MLRVCETMLHVMVGCSMDDNMSLIHSHVPRQELCAGGNLYDYLRASPRLDLSSQLRLACDCSRSVSYLHSHTPSILHLDLKSMNFLLHYNGSIKVADLEMSREVVVQESEHEISQTHVSSG